MGLIKGIFKFIGDILGGFLNGLLDWIIETLDKINAKLDQIVDAVLAIFNYVPSVAKSFDILLRGSLWFVPDYVFNTIYVGIAIIFLILLYKAFKHFWGK